MSPRPDLAQQSWRDVARTYRRFAAQNGTDYSAIHAVIDHVSARGLSARLHASTSHELLNVATAHRHDSGSDVIRVSLVPGGIRFEYFDSAGIRTLERFVAIAESIPAFDDLLEQLTASAES
jgi:hypothetical protein